jgi:hypothetical protein
VSAAQRAWRRERLLEALTDTLVRVWLARAGVDFRRGERGKVAFDQNGQSCADVGAPKETSDASDGDLARPRT